MPKNIPGNPGTLASTGTAPATDPTPKPTPSSPRTTTTATTTTESVGRLVKDGSNYFVLWGNNRIPVETGGIVTSTPKICVRRLYRRERSPDRG